MRNLFLPLLTLFWATSAFGQGVVGPGSSVVNDLACWNNTSGTLLKDCGPQAPTFDVRNYGAVCNGVADDVAALTAANAAASAAGGGIVLLPPNCATNSTITVSAKVTFVGQGDDVVGVKALSSNMTMFSLAGNYAGVMNMKVDQTAFVDTSGCGISIANGVSFAQVQQVRVDGPFRGICNLGSLVTIRQVAIVNITPTTGLCLDIAGGVNVYMLDIWCGGLAQAQQSAAAVKITGGGGHVLFNVQGLFTGKGLEVYASGGTSIEWIFSVNTVMDSGTGIGLYIHADSGGVVKGFESTGDWYSSFGGNGVQVNEGAGGTIDQIRLNGARIFGNGQFGVAFSFGDNLQLVNSSVCGNSQSSLGSFSGVLIETNTSNVQILNNRIGNCALLVASQGAGIYTLGPSIQIIGNDLTGNVAVPFSMDAVPSTAILENNIGIDNGTVVTLASAATLALTYHPIINVSGTAKVTSITNGWPGRTVKLYAGTVPGFYVAGAALCGGAANKDIYIKFGRFVTLTLMPTPLSCWSVDSQDQNTPFQTTFAGLPINVAAGAQAFITDSNTATWGAAAAGGGANAVLVQWNGSVWTVIGK